MSLLLVYFHCFTRTSCHSNMEERAKKGGAGEGGGTGEEGQAGQVAGHAEGQPGCLQQLQLCHVAQHARRAHRHLVRIPVRLFD